VDNVSDFSDKDIYQEASDYIHNLVNGSEDEPELELELNQFLTGKLTNAMQSTVMDQSEGKVDGNGNLLSAGTTLNTVSSLGSTLRGSGFASGLGMKLSTAGNLSGGVGGFVGKLTGAATGAASGLAGFAGSAISVALALAPLIKSMAADMERTVEKGLEEVSADREKIEAEVSDLLASVNNLATEENVENQKKLAEDLLEKVKNPNALTFSTPQGMGLQKQLAVLETTFSPTTMASLVPYTSNEELVAGKYFVMNRCAICDMVIIVNLIYSTLHSQIYFPYLQKITLN
jgi:hypothetical protein